MRFIRAIQLWLLAFFKGVTAFIDHFHPDGWVEMRLIHATGPNKGQVARIIKGRNIVTSWQSSGGAAPTGGRDLMRRILVSSSLSGGLAGATDAYVAQIQLGSGTTAETAADTALGTAIAASKKTISSVEFDGSDPYVTFIVEYDESEVNQTISEMCVLSGSTREDFFARKTFGSFTKTHEYTLEVRYTLRF